MNEKVLFFLRPFTLKNPTTDQQTAFILQQTTTAVECSEIGPTFGNDDLFGHDIMEFISEKVKLYQPDCIVAENECASASLKLRKQKKILLNPTVTTEDLNNVTDFSRQITIAFFDNLHWDDYERFLTAYPHGALNPEDDDLQLLNIGGFIKNILKTGRW